MIYIEIRNYENNFTNFFSKIQHKKDNEVVKIYKFIEITTFRKITKFKFGILKISNNRKSSIPEPNHAEI